MKRRPSTVESNGAATGFAFRQGLDWEQLADGRVHRLKRGKHYRGEMPDVMLDLASAAQSMGKYAHVVKDPLGHQFYLWVQFLDGEIALGECCPCGHRSLVRYHQGYVRCEACGNLLHLKGDLSEGMFEEDDADDDEDEEPNEDRPRARRSAVPRKFAERLEDYADVHLVPYDRSAKVEAYRGYGTKPSGRHLLLAFYYLGADGERLEDPWRPGEPYYRIETLPAEPFADGIDFGRL